MTSSANQQGFPGQQALSSDTESFNLDAYLIDRMLSRVSTATMVKVTKVSTNGAVAPVGTVSVQPLVKLADGGGKVFDHGIVHNLPYFRMQGGAGKAVIMDPKVGDVGVAVFADRDISSVKKNKKASPPGSWRRFDMADGMFFGSFLGEAPTCYIRFTDDNKLIFSPDDGTTVVTVEADKITLQIGALMIVMKNGKIFLGEDDAANAVMTDAGASTVVFAKI